MRLKECTFCGELTNLRHIRLKTKNVDRGAPVCDQKECAEIVDQILTK
jgi:hypothetical protein